MPSPPACRAPPNHCTEKLTNVERQIYPAMRHDYHVVYTPIEDGWVMATVPELPGAVTQGRDLDEARENIKEAV